MTKKIKKIETSVENTKNPEALVDGLEQEENQEVDFSNREYLETNAPIFTPENTSSKYDEKREAKVQAGLEIIKTLMGDKINPTLVLPLPAGP